MEQKKERNEKSFVWHDIKLHTIFGIIFPETSSGSFHAHTQYEMFVFKSANGYLKIDGKKIRLSRNNLILIPPNTNHAIVFDDPSSVKGITITFRYKKINDNRQQKNGQMFAHFHSLMPTQNNVIVLKDKAFGNFCNDFLEETESVPALASSLIIHLLQGIFLRFMRCILNHRNSEEPVSLYSYTTTSLSNSIIIESLIEIFMSKPNCTLENIANNLNMSPRNIQRILKKTCGKSYSEKLAQVRLTIAVDLMANPNYSLREIAEKSNYNKYDSFRKAFLLNFGMSPSQYREKLLSKK